MGVVLSRAEVVRGLEPLTTFSIDGVGRLVNRYEDCCPMPALWERAFHELLGCFSTPEACKKAFFVLDTDQNGIVDALELLGALAVVSKGHLAERMKLVYDIFDFNKEGAMAFDECFLMLRRTMGGMRKMFGIALPPETVIHSMVKAVWNSAKKTPRLACHARRMVFLVVCGRKPQKRFADGDLAARGTAGIAYSRPASECGLHSQ